jgi:hypothetical protein
MDACAVCERAASARCERCRRRLCRAHAPPVPSVIDECCDPCEAEYRPFSLVNVGIRLAMSGAGTALGAALALAVFTLAGSLLFLGDPMRVRVLAMAGAMLGTVVGFGLANVAASAVIRARFVHDRPWGLIPRARVVRRLGARRARAAVR